MSTHNTYRSFDNTWCRSASGSCATTSPPLLTAPLTSVVFAKTPPTPWEALPSAVRVGVPLILIIVPARDYADFIIEILLMKPYATFGLPCNHYLSVLYY